MRLHALLSFYDEDPALLVECVKSLALTGVDHVVAVDGAYALYPNCKAASHPNQHAAITLACRELGVGCTLHVPSAPWAGNEVSKRNFLFALAWATADAGDWFMVHDADMIVTRYPKDLKARLAGTDHQAAEVEILDTPAVEANQPDWPERFTFRAFYRAQPITVAHRHCTYLDADGNSLWCGNGPDDPMPVLDLTADVLIEHRPQERTRTRQDAKLQYYAQREATGVERGPCEKCGVKAVRLVATKWRKTRLGPVGEWQELCEPHAAAAEKVGRIRLRQVGGDPDRGVENRMGRAPAGMTK